MSEREYDVALSFAGEDRAYVEKVARALKDASVRVFYDDYEKATLWGKDLYAHLDWVYRKASQYSVLFISEHYARKVWTKHERSSAQARAIEENVEYVLPVKFDNTEIPGIRPTIGYLDGAQMPPKELAKLIREKLGPRTVTPGFPHKPDILYKALGLHGGKAKEAKRQAFNVALSFYEALARMTEPERKAVAGVMAFGCRGELPRGVHISLDYLSRMTEMPQAEIMNALSGVRSLNVKVVSRDGPESQHINEPEEGELRKEDKDLLVSFWSSREPEATDPTRIVFEAVRNASGHLCEEHGLQAVCLLDFHMLSSDALGPVQFPHEDGDGGGGPEARS